MAKKGYIDIMGDLDEEQIERIAKQLDVPIDHVKETIVFTTWIRREIEEQNLTLQQSIAGLMSVVADLLRHSLPEIERGEACTAIYHNLWGACDLPSDKSFKAMKYEFTKTHIN
jgi:hypothetical protein